MGTDRFLIIHPKSQLLSQPTLVFTYQGVALSSSVFFEQELLHALWVLEVVAHCSQMAYEQQSEQGLPKKHSLQKQSRKNGIT